MNNLLRLLREGPLTVALVVLNVAVFAAGAAGLERELFALGANYGPLTVGGHQWWRLGTALFLHGGFLHLAFNLYALWGIGATAEQMFGRGRFVGGYLLAGLCGSLASVVWNTEAASVGASGAIFGTYGAVSALLYFNRHRFQPGAWIAVRNNLLQFVALNLALGLMLPRVDNAGHVGGLLGGVLWGTFWGNRRVLRWLAAALLLAWLLGAPWFALVRVASASHR